MPTVSANGVETYYERRGTGPPVVFVHGAIVDHAQWEPQLDALSDEYTTIAYDVRGHGRTGPSDVEPYSVELFAADLDALLTALDVDRPVLCGLSLGGCIAQVYAASHPDSISGLVLADTFSPEILDWRQRLQFRTLAATVLPVRLVGYERVERAMVWLQERIQGRGVSGDYEKIQALRADAPTMTTAEFGKVIRALTGFHEVDVDLGAITAPTLVAYGEHDAGFVRRHAPRLAAAIPNATLRTIPDAGHAANLDNPEYVTDALREFLATVHPGAT